MYYGYDSHQWPFIRKRSDYRRPSALGVPDARFHKSSEYLANYEAAHQRKTPRRYASSSNLAEAANREMTENLNGKAPRPQTTMVVNEGDIEWRTERDELKGQYIKKIVKNRPRTKLRSEGEIEWKTANKDDYYAHYNDDVIKASRLKKGQEDKILLPQGQLDERSESSSQYVSHQGVKKVVGKRPNTNILRPQSRDTNWTAKEQYKTFSKKDTKPVRVKKAADHLQVSKANSVKMETQSESRNQYKSNGIIKREKLTRPSSNLSAKVGEMNFGPSKTMSYIPTVKPVKIKGKADNLRPFEGSMEGSSETKMQYKLLESSSLKRPSKLPRPVTSLVNEGNLDLRTSKALEYNKGHHLSRLPIRADKAASQRKTTLVMNTHDEDKSIYQRTNYYATAQNKPEKGTAPPATLIYEKGLDFEKGTENGEYLKPDKIQIKPRERPTKRDSLDHLMVSNKQEPLELNTTSKEAFRQFPLEGRIKRVSANGSSSQAFNRSKSADSKWSLTSHDYKEGFNSKRPDKVI